MPNQDALILSAMASTQRFMPQFSADRSSIFFSMYHSKKTVAISFSSKVGGYSLFLWVVLWGYEHLKIRKIVTNKAKEELISDSKGNISEQSPRFTLLVFIV